MRGTGNIKCADKCSMDINSLTITVHGENLSSNQLSKYTMQREAILLIGRVSDHL